MSFARRLVRKVLRTVREARKRRVLTSAGISFLKPNYIFWPRFDESSLIVDIGCGRDAEFAVHAVEVFGSRAVAVDPTRKHAGSLKALESKWSGRLKYLNYAIAASDAELLFYESVENESGSLLGDHINVVSDQTQSYTVQAVTLPTLLQKIGSDQADLLKLDLEGAEYDLLRSVGAGDLSPFAQIFVEFHHHCIESRTEQDTFHIVTRLKGFGMESYTIDGHNYLFCWPR